MTGARALGVLGGVGATLVLAALAGCTASNDVAEPPPAPVTPPPPPEASAVAPPLVTDPVLPLEAEPAIAVPAAPTGPLSRFFAALGSLERRERTDHVRMMWIGDSHAAADYWSGAVRSTLQTRFGKAGPGYVYLGYKGYRHDGVTLDVAGKWGMYPKGPATSKPTGDGAFGLGGVLLRGFADAPRVTMTLGDIVDPQAHLVWDLCYKLGAASDELTVSLGNGPRQVLRQSAGDASTALRRLALTSVGPAALQVTPTAGRPQLCGVVVETDPVNGPGLVLDMLGINGARFGTVLAWNEQHWAEEVARRKPELVLLEFGTNEASDPNTRPQVFGRQLEQVVARIRRALPEADCGIVAPTDRADTEERMGPIRDALRDSARNAGCWFFDTYQAMGGRGAAKRWRDEVPPRVASDGIHLTNKGYRELGQALAGALLRGYAGEPKP